MPSEDNCNYRFLLADDHSLIRQGMEFVIEEIGLEGDIFHASNLNKLMGIIEKESIDLYKEFLSEAKNEVEKNLFQYLIKEEEKHFQILEDIVLLVNRPEEWIESAEFGLREEY